MMFGKKYLSAYEKFLRNDGLDEAILRLASGKIHPASPRFEGRWNWYGFPPALCPILCDGSWPQYEGYWRHWFCDRTPTFVSLSVDSGRKVSEIARTAEQWKERLILCMIVEADGINERLRQFADKIGIQNLADIDSVSVKTGDRPEGLMELPSYNTNRPLETAKESYEGDFPTSHSLAEGNVDVCSFELIDELITEWSSKKERPPWLVPGARQEQLFQGYLAERRYKEAWFTLNSTGWAICDARVAARQLMDAASDPLLAVLIEAWLKASSKSGSY